MRDMARSAPRGTSVLESAARRWRSSVGSSIGWCDLEVWVVVESGCCSLAGADRIAYGSAARDVADHVAGVGGVDVSAADPDADMLGPAAGGDEIARFELVERHTGEHPTLRTRVVRQRKAAGL